MSRPIRLFEIIQLLRRANAPVTAQSISETLEVTKRTVYRDIAALQSMRVPVEGAAGVGYVMRRGFDLPPLMFTVEEVEALIVGLSLLGRTGDAGLESAAAGVARKLGDVLPPAHARKLADRDLYASSWNAIPAPIVALEVLRRAIREEETVFLRYCDSQARTTARTIKPLALIYYVDSVVLAGWCELRRDYRHFRADRMVECRATGGRFSGEGETLRGAWRQQHHVP